MAVHRRYPGLPLLVTENGAAFEDEVAPDGRVHDEARVAYLQHHVANVEGLGTLVPRAPSPNR